MYAAEILFTLLAPLWCASAWHFADPSPGKVRAGWAVFSLIIPLAVLMAGGRVAALSALAILAITLVWYLRLRPSKDHDWETEYARAPVARREGNLVHVTDVRNFRYRGVTDPIPAWYDATYDIDTLTGVDLICSYWAGEAIAHVFLSFGFSDGRHLAVSVETRRRRGQEYSSIAGFFRHYHLIFVIADERDLIGVRTDIRRERVFLYRLRITPEETRRLFGGYIDRASGLSERPEFYNTLTNNCTSNIVRIIDRGLPRTQRLGLSWRLLFSGYADAFAYDAGRLRGRMPFAKLKRQSRIVRPPDAVIGEDFSAAIRPGRSNAAAPARSG
jgi:hypothetical protein